MSRYDITSDKSEILIIDNMNLEAAPFTIEKFTSSPSVSLKDYDFLIT